MTNKKLSDKQFINKYELRDKINKLFCDDKVGALGMGYQFCKKEILELLEE